MFPQIDALLCFVSVSNALQKKLTTLDIAANRIKKIENISHLTELQEFWVRIKDGRILFLGGVKS